MGKNEIGKYIQIVSRQLKRNMDEILSKYSVTGVQSMVIGYIYRKSKQGEVFAKDIEEEFDMRKATVAGIIQLMEANGLIMRKAKEEDCRLKSIVLTPKALEIEKIAEKQINVTEKNIVKEMSKEEQEMFLSLLKKASKNLYKLDVKWYYEKYEMVYQIKTNNKNLVRGYKNDKRKTSIFESCQNTPSPLATLVTIKKGEEIC